MKTLDFIEEIHGSNPDSAIIWLHGLGADGFDFKPIVQQLELPDDMSVHFVFPHAPVQPVTLNQGMSMRSWYDIYKLSIDAKEDETGINESMLALEALISSKFSHLESHKILLAGFSQGGALAFHTLLHGSLEFGGLIALSTYLPLRDKLAQAKRIPKHKIFMAHGIHDEILPIYIAELAKEVLSNAGIKTEWHSYPMAHQLCMDEIKDIRAYILKCFSS
ncbi:MAG: dienelactone hydrolase family protein [Pseudomonadota bacterium]